MSLMHRTRKKNRKFEAIQSQYCSELDWWGHDLFQQWNIQINIPPSPKTYVSEENIRRYYRQWTPAIQAVQQHKAIDKPSKVPMVLPLKWLTETQIQVKQWALVEEKLQALNQLVQEQLNA